MYVYVPSIPVDVAAVRTLFLPLERIGQCACIGRKRKVITHVRTEYHTTAHAETVQVA